MIAPGARPGSVGIRGVTLAYLGLLVAVPVAVLVFQVVRADRPRFSPPWLTRSRCMP